MQMRWVWIAIALAFAPAAARADGVQGKLECWRLPAHSERELLTDGKHDKLTDDVECVISSEGDTGNTPLTGHLHVVRHSEDGKDIVSNGTDQDFGPLVEGHAQLRQTLKSGIDFRACESFDVVAKILDDKKRTLWTKRLKISLDCPKPKPVAVKVTCTQKEPGKDVKVTLGGKRFQRLHADLSCLVTSKDEAFADLKITGDASWKGGTQHVEGTRGGDVVFPSSAWDRCADIDFYIAGIDADNTVRFSQTIKTSFPCP